VDSEHTGIKLGLDLPEEGRQVTFNLKQQTLKIRYEIFVHISRMNSEHSTQQNAAESGRRLNRQEQSTKRQPTRGGNGARVKDLKLSQKHG
jgi:hypothetical protein